MPPPLAPPPGEAEYGPYSLDLVSTALDPTCGGGGEGALACRRRACWAGSGQRRRQRERGRHRSEPRRRCSRGLTLLSVQPRATATPCRWGKSATAVEVQEGRRSVGEGRRRDAPLWRERERDEGGGTGCEVREGAARDGEGWWWVRVLLDSRVR